METVFNYNAPENHVQTRDGISPVLRKSLLESERAQWPEDPRFGENAYFWLQVHGLLLNNTEHLAAGLQGLLDEPASSVADAFAASGLANLSRQTIWAAHHHHHMEDDHYFPRFARIMPEIKHSIALLDGDHRVLEKALKMTEISMAALGKESIVRDGIAKALAGAKLLEAIMSRHLYDEEEIIIPLLLMEK